MLSTALPYVIAGFSLLALVFSFLALQLSLRQPLAKRELQQLRLFCAELDDNHEALLASHKRLRSRVGMRELRARKKENGADTEPRDVSGPDDDELRKVAEWKKKMRLAIHRGEIKP